MKPNGITADNALKWIKPLLCLPPTALRAPFRKTFEQHHGALQRALVAYCCAHQIVLPPGRPARHTRWYRLNTLVNQMNQFLCLLTEEALATLQDTEN